MNLALRLVTGFSAITMVGGNAPAMALATDDTVLCDPATGCMPSPLTSPPADLPTSYVSPVSTPAPIGEPPAAVRKLRITVRRNDADSVQGFNLGLKWSGGTRASSFLVRLEKVSFKALSPGDTAKKPGQFMQVKSGGWIDTKTAQPKSWAFTIPKATAFYRVQVRGQNPLGAGPIAQQYLLVAKDNEKTLIFRSGG
ncbi:MAG: hypothetical protein R2720_12420 [Candidatus Nanopelagicales bacterium]